MQHKEQSARFDLANDKKSGFHMAIVCRMLNRKPCFLSKADAQVSFTGPCILMCTCKQWKCSRAGLKCFITNKCIETTTCVLSCLCP